MGRPAWGVLLASALVLLSAQSAVADEIAGGVHEARAAAHAPDATVAVASETRRDFGYPLITVVRIVFARAADAWTGFPDPSYSQSAAEGARTDIPLPSAARWNACFDGRLVGTVTTAIAANLSAIALTNVHQPSPGERVPFQGKPTPEFGGWLAQLAHRPLVLSSRSCTDPERWRASPIPAATIATLLPAFRDAVAGVHGCDTDGKSTGRYEFAASDVVVGKSYVSRRGGRIVTLTLRERPEITGGCNDGPLDDQWLPHTFAVLANGTVRHLGSSLKLIDAGDYDGDGRSEVVFAFARYDYDGYTLFWDGFEHSVSYGWIYH